jgi:hypothetical protein
MIIYGFTGHRPDKLGGYGDDAFRSLVVVATGYLRMRADRGEVDECTSGMAQGWDQACAEACCILGLPWTAAIPFLGQESKWPAAARKRYDQLINKAARVQFVSPGNFAVWKLHKRNEWMVDASHKMVACWDGVRGQGGTAACIAYAEKVGKPYDNLFERWRTLT